MKHFATAFTILISATTAFAQDGNVRVVVGYNGPVDESVFAAHGGSSIKTLKIGSAAVGMLPVGKIEKVRALAGVAYVNVDSVCEVQGGRAAGKPGSGGVPSPTPTAEPYVSGMTPWGVQRIGAPTAQGGAGVLVGIVDTGVDSTHPDLAGRIIGGTNTIGTGSANFADDNDHGTHVAGTVGANQNAFGVVGVAPLVSIYAAKGLDANGSGYSTDLAEGIDACRANGARVISMSWGGSFADPYTQAAVTAAIDADIVLCAASGNDGNKRAVIYPAAYAGVMAIGATDSNNNLTSFTNTRGGLDLVAPGLYIWSTVPGGYARFSGTSMATPHVSASAALVRAKNSSWTRSQVESQLKATATQISGGWWLVNAGLAAP